MGYYTELLARVLSLSDDQTYHPVWEIFNRRPEYLTYLKYYGAVMCMLIITSLVYARYYSYLFNTAAHIQLPKKGKDLQTNPTSGTRADSSDGDTYCWTAARGKKRKGYTNISASSPPKPVGMERANKDVIVDGLVNTR